jgi:hypothetical protein
MEKSLIMKCFECLKYKKLNQYDLKNHRQCLNCYEKKQIPKSKFTKKHVNVDWLNEVSINDDILIYDSKHSTQRIKAKIIKKNNSSISVMKYDYYEVKDYEDIFEKHYKLIWLNTYGKPITIRKRYNFHTKDERDSCFSKDFIQGERVIDLCH